MRHARKGLAAAAGVVGVLLCLTRCTSPDMGGATVPTTNASATGIWGGTDSW